MRMAPIRKTRFAFLCLVLVAGMFRAPAGAGQPSLVQRLGFSPEARLLIVNADDFGMNHTTCVATIDALKSGGVTSSTIMVPCPWFPMAAEFARSHPQANLGVHLTHTSEWKRYKWGPVLGCSAVPGLCTPQGYFHNEAYHVYFSAMVDEAVREARAQIDKALAAGIDVTHIDSHMGTMQYAPHYHERYLKIAKDYNLPCRMAGHDIMDRLGGGRLIQMADDFGVLHPDLLHMGDPKSIEDTEPYWKRVFDQLEPGTVTEIYIHCGQMTPEMRATTGSAGRRTADTEFFSQPSTLAYFKAHDIELISYRELRHLQRHGVPMPRVTGYGWE